MAARSSAPPPKPSPLLLSSSPPLPPPSPRQKERGRIERVRFPLRTLHLIPICPNSLSLDRPDHPPPRPSWLRSMSHPPPPPPPSQTRHKATNSTRASLSLPLFLVRKASAVAASFSFLPNKGQGSILPSPLLLSSSSPSVRPPAVLSPARPRIPLSLCCFVPCNSVFARLRASHSEEQRTHLDLANVFTISFLCHVLILLIFTMLHGAGKSAQPSATVRGNRDNYSGQKI